jgi:DNA polymerase
MPPLTTSELRMWRLDQTINRRGVRVDVEGAKAAVKCVADYKGKMEKELAAVTGGYITTVNQHARLKEWCECMGVSLPNTAKDTLQYYLREEKLPGDVNLNGKLIEAGPVRRALEIRVSSGQTSVTKYEAMLRAAAEDDNRVRGVFKFCGASTGRWTANLVQLHNMPRGTIKWKKKKEPKSVMDSRLDSAFSSMAVGHKEVEVLYGDIMGLAASAIRGCIVAAPDKEFVVSDFKSVEARVLAWLACEDKALQVFRDGQDPYIIAAMAIFGVAYAAVTDEQRQVGKCSVLALGYGGGIGAYSSMARGYGIDLETLIPLVLPSASGSEFKRAESIAKTFLKNLEKRIKLKIEKGIGKASPLERMSLNAAIACDIIKQRWRGNRPGAITFWNALESAAFAAIQNPGEVFIAGPHIQIGVHENFMLMKLPSGRCIRYFKPEIKQTKKFDKMAPTITYMRTIEGKWVRTSSYGGKLCENADQGIGYDLLCNAMFNVEAAGYPIILHVHDEPATEVKEGFGSQEEFDALMVDAPAWAQGLPLAAEGWRGKRYRKD